MIFVGDDWAEDHHDVHVMNEGPPVDRSRWLRGLVGLGLTVVVLPLEGREVAEARVEPLAVVAVDPAEDRAPCASPVREPVAGGC